MRYRLSLLGLHLMIFMVLAYGYEHYISVLYAYEGFGFRPDEGKRYFALVAVCALSLITPTDPAKPSTAFHHLLLTVILIPMLVLFYAEDLPLEYTLQVLTAYAVTIVLPFFLDFNAPAVGAVSRSSLQRFLFFATGIFIASIFAMGGAAYLNFDFSRVTDFREDAANNLPGIFGYVSPLVGKVVVPIGFVLALISRRYLYAAAFLGFSILIFALTAHKAPVFYPFLLLLVYFAVRKDDLALKLNIGILLVLLLSLLDFQLLNSDPTPYSGWTGALMMKRNFFLPAQINHMYFDFFSKNGLVLFSDSKLSLGLIPYPYALDPSHLIGLEYFNDERRGANTGWLGSGYMQAGFAGLLLYAVIIGCVFRYIDVCARTPMKRRLITASSVVPVFAMISFSDLPTTFLTHGLLINLILVAYLSRSMATDEAPAAAQSPANLSART